MAVGREVWEAFGAQPPSDSYADEAGLRRRVALSPQEQADNAARETSERTRASLDTAIAEAPHPAARSALEETRRRDFGAAAPAAPAADVPDEVWKAFGAQREQAPRQTGRRGNWTSLTPPVVAEEGGGQLDYFLNDLRVGWNTLRKTVEGQKLNEWGELLSAFDRKYTPEQVAADPKLREERALRESKFRETQERIKAIDGESESLQKSGRPSYRALQEANDGSWTFDNLSRLGKTLVENPGSAVSIVTQSGPASAAMLASAVLARFAGFSGGVAAGAGGLASQTVEFGNDYAELREKGESHEQAYKQALIKSGVVGLLDAVSMKSAGNALDSVLGSGGFFGKVKRVGRELGTQAGLGMAGEAGGSLLSGRTPDPLDVLAEGVGELAMGPVEAVTTFKGRPRAQQGPERERDAAPVAAEDILGRPAAPTADEEQQARVLTPSGQDPAVALRRADEIDALLREAPDAPDAGELSAEREQISEGLVPRVAGQQTAFTTESGARIEAEFSLVEASDLVASHTPDMKANPVYPEELQPRDRSRAASELQVAKIAGNLTPERLGESGDAGTGAPIVGADGLVESGNARTIGIQRAYSGATPTAQRYRDWITANASRFGIDPDAAASMRAPVLVRVRRTPVNRVEFARQANQATVAQMSPSELARTDAARMGSLDALTITDDGEFMVPANDGIIRGFFRTLPVTEQAALVDANGRISQAGYARFRNALLAKAYGNNPVVARLSESMSPLLRNLTNALIRMAPMIAKAKEAMQQGAIAERDITDDIVRAVDELVRMRQEGRSLGQVLAQASMFPDLTPETLALMEFLDENVRAPARIGEFVAAYLGELERYGSQSQGDMFGGVEVPGRADLIKTARAKVMPDAQEEPAAAQGQPAEGGSVVQGGAAAAPQPAAAEAGGVAEQRPAEVPGPAPAGEQRPDEPGGRAGAAEGAGEDAGGVDPRSAEDAAAVKQRNAWADLVLRWFESAPVGSTLTEGDSGEVYTIVEEEKKRDTGTVRVRRLVDSNGNAAWSYVDGKPTQGVGTPVQLGEGATGALPVTSNRTSAEVLGKLLADGVATTQNKVTPKPKAEKKPAAAAPSPVTTDRLQEFRVREKAILRKMRDFPDDIGKARREGRLSASQLAVLEEMESLEREYPEYVRPFDKQPSPAKQPSAEAQAQADLDAALGDLGDLLGKGTRLNVTPEQEAKLVPILTRLFDAAFRLGYHKFKRAAKFVLDTVRAKLGADVADQITIEHLQGAYIGMSGKYREQGADAARDVVAIDSLDAVQAPEAPAVASAPTPVDEAAGLRVTKTSTKNGADVWEVSGNTREHSDLLKSLGGRWYGPKKVWSFYKGDPTAQIAGALGPAKATANASGAVTAPEREPAAAQAETTANVAPAHQRIAEWVKARLHLGQPFTSNDLFGQADAAFGGTQAEGKYTPKDAYDALELGVNQFILGWTAANPTATASAAKMNMSRMKTLMERIPSQTKRTQEQDEFQQFSTPPTYAYLANWVANIRPGDVYLEPSAGIGGLAVFAKNAGATVIVNEFSPRRATILRAMGFDRAFTENAEQLHNTLPDDVRPTVIVMNPPFSATAGRIPGQRDFMNGARHIDQALQRLVPGGRLVVIMGKGRFEESSAWSDWISTVKRAYNLRADVVIDGKEYAKYGTTFDVRVMVFDKTGTTKVSWDTVKGEVSSPADALALLEGVRNDRPQVSGAGKPVQPGASQPARPSDAQGAGGASGGARPVPPATPAVGDRQPGAGPVERPAGTSRPNGQDARPGAGVQAPDGGRRDGRDGDGQVRVGEQPEGSGAADSKAGARPDSEVTVSAAEDAAAKADITESVFESYAPQRLVIPGAKPHPGKLVQSAAMATVQPPAPTYQPNLPKSVIEDGELSLAQLEAVVYAGQAHSQLLPSGERMGFFIGDGTGVGKGREISGIILDNMRQGRKRAVWISEKQGLYRDAQRDFKGVGGNAELLFKHSATKYGEQVKATGGILFTTYATLRMDKQRAAKKKGLKVEAGKSRVDQIVDWLGADFDGVIAFDEAHNLGNAVALKSGRGVVDASEQALAGVELQKKLPNARIVYVSATGATEVSNLSYAVRLGLWGEGTPFQTVHQFIGQIEDGGLSGMELVARDMKQMGAYLARSLSFDGVTYSRLEHPLTNLQRDIYNELARAWQIVLQNVNEALELTGAYSKEKGKPKDGRARGSAMSAFWGAHQRFFNQIITSMQMPVVIEQLHKDIAAGDAAVLQLVNTNEATQNRQIATRAEDETLEDLDLTPRENLIQYIQNSFPTVQYEQYVDDEGNKRTRPVKDSAGNVVHSKEAIAKRDALIETLKTIRVPDGPLEIILNEFGVDTVAEVTGRGKRVLRVKEKDGSEKVVVETRPGNAAHADAEAFMADKKRILIFSDAGGTGFSFHADLTKKNQRKRKHYLIQPGWRANKAVQGFGRTHRTNQKSEPHYYLVTTDLLAQKRFISSIARRLDQLGALTKGQRDTANQGLFTAKDNLESSYAEYAVLDFFLAMHRGKAEGFDFQQTTKMLGFDNLLDEKTGQIIVSKIPHVPQFLNRLLSLETHEQERVFSEFARRMELKIDKAIAEGTLDAGMQTVRAQEVRVKSEQVVNTDQRTGAETRYVEFELTQPTRFYNFDDFVGRNSVMFYQNIASGKVWAVMPGGRTTKKDGSVVDRYYVHGTGSGRYVETSEITPDKFKPLKPEDARALWDAENAVRPKTYTEPLHMVTGSLLPVWDRIPGFIRVARTQTVDGRRYLGRIISPSDLRETLKRLGADSPAAKLSPAEVMAEVMDRGNIAELANGWRLLRRRVSGESRLEVDLRSRWPSEAVLNEIKRIGGFVERIQFQERAFLPSGNADVLARLMKTRPVVDMVSQKDDSAPKMSRAGAALSYESMWSGEIEGAQATQYAVADDTGREMGSVTLVERDGKPVVEGRGAAPQRGARASQATRQAGAEARAEARAEEAVARVSAELEARMGRPADALGVKIVGGIADLPDGLRSFVTSQDATDTQGVFDPETGDTYLVASNIAPGRAFAVYLHELGVHKGMLALLGREQMSSLVRTIKEWAAGSTSEEGRLARIAAARIPEGTPSGVYDEELLAYFVEEAVKAGHDIPQSRPERGRLAQWLHDLWAAVRGALEKLGVAPEALTASEVVTLARGAAERAMAGTGQAESPSIVRSVFEAPWYSALLRAVRGAKLQAAPAAQWAGTIKAMPGVKADEVEWSGVLDWLATQLGKVTREQVVAYLEQNGVRVEEVVLDDEGQTDLPEGWQVRRASEGYDSEYPWVLVDENDEVRGAGNTQADAISDGWDADASADAPTKYSNFQLPGGENYRELLLTLPVRNDGPAVALDDVLSGRARLPNTIGPEFRSSHFDQPNIVAHVRFNERTDADGRRVLFLEELQSDWAQSTRKYGIVDASRMATKAEAKGQGSQLYYEVTDAQGRFITNVYGTSAESEQAAIDEANRRIRENPLSTSVQNAVPGAPFVTKTDSWVSLALKRMIRYGSEHGFDAIAWTTGEQQAARYDLSKQISRVEYDDNTSGGVGDARMDGPPSHGQLVAYDLDGKKVISQPILDPAQIADFIGKDAAEKLLAAKPAAKRVAGLGVRRRRLSGLDLKVGGEGMKSFYDRIVPAVAKDVLKKLVGGKVEDVSVRIEGDDPDAMAARIYGAGTTYRSLPFESRARVDEQMRRGVMKQPGFTITPELRAKAMQGMPLFSRAVQPQSGGQVAPFGVPVRQRPREGMLNRVVRGAFQTTRADRLSRGAVDLALRIGEVSAEKLTPAVSFGQMSWEDVKAGMVDKYGLDEVTIDRRAQMYGHQAVQLRGVKNLLDQMATLTRAEAAVLYRAATTADAAEVEEMIAGLDENSQSALRTIKQVVRDLGAEAVRLGQMTDETFRRNEWAYLHRSYLKHELDDTESGKASRARRIQILGDHYKRRGLVDWADPKKIANVAPEFWGRKAVPGRPDYGLKGQKFVRLERRKNRGEGVAVLDGMEETGQRGRLLEVLYWPAGEAIPARYGSWDNVGTWEARFFGERGRGGAIGMWRDFTADERQQMGEIDDIRYAFAKTMHTAIHNVEVGKYLLWLADTHAVPDEGRVPEGATLVERDESSLTGLRRVFRPNEWVRVPDTRTHKGGPYKYGALAGKIVPGPIWNDVRQVVNNRWGPEWWNTLLRAWKISKTALSPAVHMNNVMANVVMADWHDVSPAHVLRSLEVLARQKRPENKRLIEMFEDSGGTQGMYVLSEIQREQLDPVLEQLRRDLAGSQMGAAVGMGAAVQALMAREYRKAFAALRESKAGSVVKVPAQKLIDLYQGEDTVFRLAAFIKVLEEGGTPAQAGKFARRSFLDYDINAPWVQALRSSVFPFISFTYRAVPMLIEVARERPWKLAKLAMILGAINAAGYLFSGGDEDEERKLLPEEKAGNVLGLLGPKLLRMPWNDENGSPVFLDIRRWMPLGDFFDVGQTHAAIPILPAAVPGGPLAVLAEVVMNKSQFTGKPITKETDTGVEMAAKVSDHLFKAFAPNLPILPGTYSWTSITNAGGGKTDAFGREQSLGQAALSSVGVKVGSYPEDVLRRNLAAQHAGKVREIGENISALRREYERKGITREQFEKRLADQVAKRVALERELAEKVGR